MQETTVWLASQEVGLLYQNRYWYMTDAPRLEDGFDEDKVLSPAH